MAVVDWFNFDASLPLLSADVDTVGASHSEAQRLIHHAIVRARHQVVIFLSLP